MKADFYKKWWNRYNPKLASPVVISLWKCITNLYCLSSLEKEDLGSYKSYIFYNNLHLLQANTQKVRCFTVHIINCFSIFAVIFITIYLFIHLLVHSLTKSLTVFRDYGQHINVIWICTKSLSTLIWPFLYSWHVSDLHFLRMKIRPREHA